MIEWEERGGGPGMGGWAARGWRGMSTGCEGSVWVWNEYGVGRE